MLETIAAIITACFCLSPPSAPDAVSVASGMAGVWDATPLICVATVHEPMLPSHECPPIRLSDPFLSAGVRPLLLPMVH